MRPGNPCEVFREIPARCYGKVASMVLGKLCGLGLTGNPCEVLRESRQFWGNRCEVLRESGLNGTWEALRLKILQVLEAAMLWNSYYSILEVLEAAMLWNSYYSILEVLEAAMLWNSYYENSRSS